MAQAPAAQQASTLTLTFGGKAIDTNEWPAQLGGATRSAAAGTSNAAAQRFLPPDYLEVLGAWDLSRSARDAAGGGEQSVAVAPGQLLMLELPDGSTLYTSGERLQQALEQMGSKALSAPQDGNTGTHRSLNLDQLRGTSADASRGLLESLGGLVSRIFLLGTRGSDGIVDAALQHLRERGEEALADKLRDGAAWGASYLATRALMWAIERQLDSPPGLHRWVGSSDSAATLLPLTPAELAADASQGPLLVFIHGTASSTQGSFADLRSAAEAARLDWAGLQARYGTRILALEHRTFSESPIENALALARMLPPGAQIDLVTHSRGGIVGDLMTLDWSDAGRNQEWIESYERFLNRDLALDADDLKDADRRDRAGLHALATEWRSRRWQVGRYVRVAAPVGGTRLAAGNIDLFLSCLLSLIGLIPALQVSPLFHALKRITLEVARSRTDPHRVPGLEAMLPGSPMARLLYGATPQASLRLGVIAGDVKGAPRFWRLAELLTDWVAFGREGNDLVVDTDSMATGVARSGQAARKFVEGAQVSHFNYFADAESRRALAGWLTAAAQAQEVAEFEPIGSSFLAYGSAATDRSAAADGSDRSERGQRASADRRPVVIVLPGIMGTHLAVGGQRIWFNPLKLVNKGLEKIRYQGEQDGRAADAAEPDQLFDSAYGDLCQHLKDQGHRVLTFPYDWRRPLPATADQLATLLNQTLNEAEPGRQPGDSAELPVRILAHSMGGLVVRAMAARHPQLWQRFIGREGARFVMLGTPNRGSHLMVEMLLGKGDTVRQLAMLDLKLKLQGVLDIVAGFPGAVSLLPHPSLQVPGSLAVDNYLNPQLWIDWKPQVFDFWFGDRRVGVPTDAAQDGAAELWALGGLKECRLPVTSAQQERVIYVAGQAERTACGVALAGGRLKMLGSARGDGSVLWQSGRIEGIGAVYQMEVPHGDLAATAEHFPALTDLLTAGRTRRLREGWPVETQRGVEAERETLSSYDAGPTPHPTDEALLAGLLGPTRRRGGGVRGARKAGSSPLQVTCRAMDLIHATDPVLVGHYQQDPISGAEAVIDRQLVRCELSTRHHLGLYPGAIGTATVVLLDANEAERRRGSQRGAVVTGLGEMGQLSAGSLTEAVRSAALRYLLSTVERAGGFEGDGQAQRQPPLEIGLATLLLGHNSTANIEIADSVRALLSGVLEANRQFDQVRRSGRKVRITRLEIIERYLDVAITATRALQSVAEELNADAGLDGSRIHAAAELQQGEGWRPRLAAAGGDNYWPRLIVTEAQPNCPDEVANDSGPSAGADPAAVAPPGQRTPSRRAGIADRLRYVYLAQRARAETEVLQRQPGLIEKLVQMSIHQPGRTADLSRTLFQLMVPLDFKEAARQTDRLALLVDDRTANMPWELLSSDGVEPMVARTAMVRQFETSQWRRRPRSTVDRLAYVVGNPSTKGFKEAFSAPGRPIDDDPVDLPGAEAEARVVSTLLRNGGYQPTESIGPRESALEVINRLFQRPYRIVHIAAHGEFELMAADGSLRSGVLLSDGLLLTAAEIDQMEVVPDLVFLNCCHLGVVDDGRTRRQVPYHRLAASLARQLIDMGVRAVVVAGWAVDDAAAKLFAETFYQGLLQQRLPFGMAVAEARRAVLKTHPRTNTWGAYQAYGDPGFLIDPTMGQDSGSAAAAAPQPPGVRQEPPFVAPQELVDALEQLEERQKARIASSAGERSPTDFAALKRQVDGLLRRAPPGANWAERGDVACAIGTLYAAFGPAGYTEAIAHLARAAQDENEAQRVPLKALETLANLESRHGERQRDAAAVERAQARLKGLISAAGDASDHPTTATPERCSLLGSALKRHAALKAASDDTDPAALRTLLAASAEWYRRGERTSAALYPRLNRMTLDALVLESVEPGHARRIGEEADDIARQAAANFITSRDYFDALMPADAAVAKALVSGRLDDPARSAGEVESLFQQYEAARRSLPESGRSMDSVRSNLELLARFARRLGPPERADALGQLAARWSPRAEGDEGGGGGAATEASRAAPSAASATGAGKTPRKPSAKTAAKAATRPWPKSSARGLEGAAALTAGQVSAHFSLQELTASDTARARGIANQPGPAELRRMKALCEQVLEPLRTALGKPITINSCYRGPELNAAVGGAANSQHVSGQAADIKVGGMTVLALFQHILQQGLPFDQLIYEAPSATSQWVHISYNADGNRSQILNAVFKPGQRTSYLGLTREQALALKPTAASRSARRAQASEPAAEPGYEERGDEPDELPAEKPRRSRSPRRARTGGTQGEG